VPEASLPVVDLDALDDASAARAVRAALTGAGFLYVRGHGIDARLLERTFGAAREFFALSTEEKVRFAYTDAESNFGYQGVEGESLDPAGAPDLKEAFTMRGVVAHGAPSWPSESFRTTVLDYHGSALRVGARLLERIAASLELPTTYFVERHQGENVTLRLLHYPANLSPRPSQRGAGAHTDYGSITLLFQDEVGGLELRDANGEWRAAPFVPGAVLVNAGDLMERWTNGLFRSTLHRVEPIRGERDRYSVVLFVDPDSDVLVECLPSCRSASRPPRFAPITAQEHVLGKLAKSHAAAAIGRSGRPQT
jgi:isopenicillin N synthase-like dioxygenase